MKNDVKVFCNHLDGEEGAGCFTDVLRQSVLCGASSWCRGLVCSAWLWYFLILITCRFATFQRNKKNGFKVVRDPCQKITLLLLKSKSVRVIVPESCF